MLIVSVTYEIDPGPTGSRRCGDQESGGTPEGARLRYEISAKAEL